MDLWYVNAALRSRICYRKWLIVIIYWEKILYKQKL